MHAFDTCCLGGVLCETPLLLGKILLLVSSHDSCTMQYLQSRGTDLTASYKYLCGKATEAYSITCLPVMTSTGPDHPMLVNNRTICHVIEMLNV